MKCVFISHSSKDANMAKALCHQLEEAGVRCWMAPRDITPGVPWSAQIADAIREASVFVLVFSQHSNKSDEVLNELGVANNAYDTGGDNPDNSPFAQALCKAMLQPGWTLEDVARDTANSTARQTQGLQRPEVGENNLTAPYRLVSGNSAKE